MSCQGHPHGQDVDWSFTIFTIKSAFQLLIQWTNAKETADEMIRM